MRPDSQTLMTDPFPAPQLAQRCWRPAADVYRTPDGWLVKLELAGVETADLLAELHGRTLRVTGIRRDALLEASCSCQSLEISYDSFEREIEFPVNLSSARLVMEMRQGMLLVRIQLSTQR